MSGKIIIDTSKRVFLIHIGAPKTGSTALQNFLALNVDALECQGWTYPRSVLRGGGHHDIAFHLLGDYPDWAMPSEVNLNAIPEILRKDISTKNRIILSSENFYWLTDPMLLKQFLENIGAGRDDVVKILLYVRRQDDAIISWYNQIVKAQGYSGSIYDCISDFAEMWNYQRKIDEWGQAFGFENIIVRPYRNSESPHDDIRKDFILFTSLDESKFHFSQQRENQNLRRDILEFQRKINTLPLSVLEKRRFHKKLIKLSHESDHLFSDFSILTPEERMSIIDYYEQGNIFVRDNYIRESGDLFSRVSSPASDPAVYGGLTCDKMFIIMSYLLFSDRD